MLTLQRSFLLASLLAAPASTAEVLVVDDGGGPNADFAILQDAIDAAPEGAILLLRPGTYPAPPAFPPSPTTIAGKSLSVVADGPAGSVVVPGLDVRGLGAAQEVLVRGIDLGDGQLEVTDCAGAVWLEEVVGVGQNFVAMGAPVRVENAAAVHLNRCSLRGPQGLLAGAPALDAVDTVLSVYDTALQGASGYQVIQTGADAVRLDGGFLYASGASLAGGTGGCGGDGLEIRGGGEAIVRDTSIAAGTPLTCNDPVPFGVDVNLVAGTFEELPGAGRGFSVGSPGQVGSSVPFAFSGEPGDLVLLDLGLGVGSAYLPSIGVLQMDQPLPALVLLGPSSAGGALVFDLALPAIGLEGLVFPLQVTAIAGSELVLTGGSALVIVTP